MKNVNLILRGMDAKNAVIFVDDKAVKTKRNNFGGQTATVQTENNSVRVRVESVLELQNPMWFLTNILFFLISCFGIFDIRPSKNFTVVEYDATISLSDGENNIALTLDLNKAPKVLAESACQIEENQNKLEVDEKLKKRKKILTISKIFTFIISVVIILTIVSIKNKV